MEIVCPNCSAAGQYAGKYCENCGYLIPADAAESTPVAPPPPDPGQAVAQASATVSAQPAGVQPGLSPTGQVVGAQFAVVRDGQASLDDGFTINREGEFLIGRMDQETGHQVDVDLRQWVQPLEVGGNKQYLVHRKQCYIDLGAGGVVSIKPCSGAEADTLLKAPGEATFTSLQNLPEKRPARPDGSFELQLHDQIYMGDPDAVMYYLSGNPTAQGNYIVIELINKS